MLTNITSKASVFINEIILYINFRYLAAFMAVLIMCFFLILRLRNKLAIIKAQRDNAVSILSGIGSGKSLEKSMSDFIELVIPLVEAAGYYFYLLDRKSGSYVLKAVRHADTGGPISPSYSGLVSYKKENYSPPLAVSVEQTPDGPGVIKDGLVPLLVMPVKGGLGLIRIGPVGPISFKTMVVIRDLCDKLQPALEMMIEMEKVKSQVESVSATSQAIRSLTKSALDLDGSLSTIMALSIKMIDAAGGCFIYESAGRTDLAVSMGLEKETEALFIEDQEGRYLLSSLVADNELKLLTREMGEFFNIPSYFAASGMETVMILKVAGKSIRGVAVFWYYHVPVIERHRIAALQMLSKRIGDALDRQLKFKELSNSYIDMLKLLVATVDNLEHYTVGHSELISRYSGIVAREMKLPPKDVMDIALAGYLHDVGMLGLSGDILFKDGKYTELEFESMKLHAEVGGALIESTVSNNSLASYIRHHHERWDGFGYPSGLKGGEIPLGARIISVVDMFNAKITGRKYREPASFERAVTDLRSASGSQLDPTIVEVLVGWFGKKQSDPSRKGRCLGLCREMRCCPPNIHRNCPAHDKYDTNCWEIEGTNCAAHGSNCSSCIVYTEFKYRSEQVVKKSRKV